MPHLGAVIAGSRQTALLLLLTSASYSVLYRQTKNLREACYCVNLYHEIHFIVSAIPSPGARMLVLIFNGCMITCWFTSRHNNFPAQSKKQDVEKKFVIQQQGILNSVPALIWNSQSYSVYHSVYKVFGEYFCDFRCTIHILGMLLIERWQETRNLKELYRQIIKVTSGNAQCKTI